MHTNLQPNQQTIMNNEQGVIISEIHEDVKQIPNLCSMSTLYFYQYNFQ